MRFHGLWDQKTGIEPRVWTKLETCSLLSRSLPTWKRRSRWAETCKGERRESHHELRLDEVGDLPRDVRSAALVAQARTLDGSARDDDEVECDRRERLDGLRGSLERRVGLHGERDGGVLDEALLENDDVRVEL